MHISFPFHALFAQFLLGRNVVSGHGFQIASKDSREPCVTYKNGQGRTAFSGTINGTAFCPGRNIATSPENNVKEFLACFKENKKYKNLDDFTRGEVKPLPGTTIHAGYGTDPGNKVTLNDTVFYGTDGLPESHHGPMQTFCDKVLVQSSRDAVVSYPSKPAEININCLLCKNAKEFRQIWIAMHTPEWQFYVTLLTITGLGDCTGKKPVLLERLDSGDDDSASSTGTEATNGGVPSDTPKQPGTSPSGSAYSPEPPPKTEPTSPPPEPATPPPAPVSPTPDPKPTSPPPKPEPTPPPPPPQPTDTSPPVYTNPDSNAPGPRCRST